MLVMLYANIFANAIQSPSKIARLRVHPSVRCNKKSSPFPHSTCTTGRLVTRTPWSLWPRRFVDTQRSRDEPRNRQTLLELLLNAEQFQQQLECDRELFQVIALGAKGIPHSRITVSHAVTFLAQASQGNGATSESVHRRREACAATEYETALSNQPESCSRLSSVA
jgi:hypothetical protein